MSVGFPRRLIPTAAFRTEFPGILPGMVFLDVESPDRIVVNRVTEVHFSGQSSFQQIDIFSTPHFGRVLALDGIIQLAEADEALYHEFFIHPACLLVPQAQSALILGGGDGCAARELLKYAGLTTVDMVEIDGMVIDACREHFTTVNEGTLKNPCLKIIVDDAVAYLKDGSGPHYDLIFADLTEPYDLSGVSGELSREFYSGAFYEVVKSRLTPRGILTLQTGGITNLPEIDRHHDRILDGLRESFAHLCTAYIHVHSFVQLWSITIASDHFYDVEGFDPEPAMRRMQIHGLKHYRRASHQKAFIRA
jgi:spermidine synthase